MQPMTPLHKVVICVVANAILVTILFSLVFSFADPNNKYLRFGPQEDLVLISVRVNTWPKWIITALLIGFIKCCEVLVNELGSPVLGFRVYNPDLKVITDFTRLQLNVLTNSMWFLNSLRYTLMVIVTIAQFDLALVGILFSETASVVAVHILLGEKEFKTTEVGDIEMGANVGANEAPTAPMLV